MAKPTSEFLLDNFLRVLADGRRHHLSDLTATIKIPKEKVEEIAIILARFNFIHFDETNRRVMINFKLRELILSDSLETTS